MGVTAGIHLEGSSIDSNQPYARTLIDSLEHEFENKRFNYLDPRRPCLVDANRSEQ